MARAERPCRELVAQEHAGQVKAYRTAWGTALERQVLLDETSAVTFELFERRADRFAPDGTARDRPWIDQPPATVPGDDNKGAHDVRVQG